MKNIYVVVYGLLSLGCYFHLDELFAQFAPRKQRLFSSHRVSPHHELLTIISRIQNGMCEGQEFGCGDNIACTLRIRDSEPHCQSDIFPKAQFLTLTHAVVNTEDDCQLLVELCFFLAGSGLRINCSIRKNDK